MKTIIITFILFIFTCTVNASEVLLSWNPNPVSDNVLGYVLYHKTTECNEWIDEEDIPLNDLSDPDNPEYVVDLDETLTYLFALKAYNYNHYLNKYRYSDFSKTLKVSYKNGKWRGRIVGAPPMAAIYLLLLKEKK